MDSWNIQPSTRALNTVNPIVDRLRSLKLPQNFPKQVYSLAVGDPTKFSGFEVDPIVINSVQQELLSGTGNGYTDSLGPLSSRQFLANRFSYPNISLTAEDVFLDIGGHGAIHTAIHAFIDPGDNLLIPAPGFPLYRTVARNIGGEAKCYRLLSQKNWQIDLAHLEQLVDERTKLLVVVDPSNPCGTIYSKEHMLQILDWAKRHQVCIMTDQVYRGMTFGKPIYPLGSLTEDVPVITIGALSKNFLVPGWRCGWILLYDKLRVCDDVRNTLKCLKNMLLHGTTFICKAIPKIFERIDEDYDQRMMRQVHQRAKLVFNRIQTIPHLQMYMADGSLYSIVSINFQEFKDINSSQEFCQKFASQQGVLIMPAQAFMAEGSFRIVLCQQNEVLNECMDRLEAFVGVHKVN